MRIAIVHSVCDSAGFVSSWFGSRPNDLSKRQIPQAFPFLLWQRRKNFSEGIAVPLLHKVVRSSDWERSAPTVGLWYPGLELSNGWSGQVDRGLK